MRTLRTLVLFNLLLFQTWNEFFVVDAYYDDSIVSETTTTTNNHKTTVIESNYDNHMLTNTISNLIKIKLTNNYEAYDFLYDFHGIPNNNTYEVCLYNTYLLSYVLQNYASYHTIIIPSNYTFYVYSGIYGNHIQNSVIQIDGIIKFEKNPKQSRFNDESTIYNGVHVLPCFMLDLSNNITITSKHGSSLNNHRGLIDGQGSNYWGIPIIGYLQNGERRPRLIRINQTSNLLIENLILQDSPYHTMYLEDVTNVTVRNISIISRRTASDGHSYVDLSAFNTDGIDVSGTNIHMHHIDIWNQDDCIAVKDNTFNGYSTNMLFENINASGLGFVIGSIGTTIVNNITFSNSYLYKSVKGLYMKFREPNMNNTHPNRSSHDGISNNSSTGGGMISNIKYENIIIDEPIQWSIWIGPAQQSDSKRLCHANPCSLCWPQIPNSFCNIVQKSYYQNITLSNITIIRPTMSPGVLLGSSSASSTSSSSNDSMFNDLDYYDSMEDDDDTNEMSMIMQSLPHIDGITFHNVQVVKDKTNHRLDPSTRRDLFLIETFPGLQQPIHERYVPYTFTKTIEEVIIRDLLIPRTHESRNISYFIVFLTPISLVFIFMFLLGRWMIRKCIKCGLFMFRNRNHYRDYVDEDYIDPSASFSDLNSPLLTTSVHETNHESFEYLEQEQQQQEGQQQQHYLNNISQDHQEEEEQHEQEYGLNVTDDVSNSLDIPRLRTDTHETVDTTTTNDTYDTATSHFSFEEVITLGVTGSLMILPKSDSTTTIISKKRTGAATVLLRCFIMTTILMNVFIFIVLICNPRTRILIRSSFDISRWGKSPSWRNTNRYYKCNGVVNGIATGTTWPVPYCLQDMTILANKERNATNV